MSPATSRTRRRPRKLSTQSRVGARDLVEAFGRYYDRVERDSVGLFTVTCTRCKVTEVIAWPDDPAYVIAKLRQAHQKHNHAHVTRG